MVYLYDNAIDGWFVSRLKPNANPEIVEELRTWRGNAIPLEGRHLQDVVDVLQRKVIDVRAQVTFQRRAYRNDTEDQLSHLDDHDVIEAL